jgi:tRNA(fMet)-specific endonuclease VapC
MEAGGVVIDTCVLIEHFRSRQKDNTILFGLSEKYTLYISAVTKFEFAVGAKPEHKEKIRAVLEFFRILAFDSKCAEIASDIADALKIKHQHAEFRDVFIAATAISENLPLSTLNIKHFRQIEGLKLL